MAKPASEVNFKKGDVLEIVILGLGRLVLNVVSASRRAPNVSAAKITRLEGGPSKIKIYLAHYSDSEYFNIVIEDTSTRLVNSGGAVELECEYVCRMETKAK